MDFRVKVIQVLVLTSLIHTYVYAQKVAKQYHFQQVSDEEFDEALDSAKRNSGKGYVLDITLCHPLSEKKKDEVRNSLRSSIRPDLDDVEIANYVFIAFGPGKASVESDRIIACISEPDMEGITYVRTISGKLELNSRRKEQRRQAMIEMEMDATKFPKDKDSCNFYWLQDTVLTNGEFLHYAKTSTELNIEWGKKQVFTRKFPETFDCSDFGTGFPALRWINKDFIGLEVGCGTQCWLDYILPINPDDSIQFIWFPVAINLETNTLAHIDEERRDKIILTHLNSGETVDVTLDENCVNEGVGACLKNVRLTNNELFIEYADWVNAPSLSIHLVY